MELVVDRPMPYWQHQERENLRTPQQDPDPATGQRCSPVIGPIASKTQERPVTQSPRESVTAGTGQGYGMPKLGNVPSAVSRAIVTDHRTQVERQVLGPVGRLLDVFA